MKMKHSPFTFQPDNDNFLFYVLYLICQNQRHGLKKAKIKINYMYCENLLIT